MGEDLQRFLEDKPIRARRPTVREKILKWSRRHRPIVVSAALLLLLTFIGSVVLTVSIAEEHAKTKKALEGEKEKKKLADERSRQARDVVDSITRISEDWLGENGDPQRGRRKILEASLKYYQSFIEQNGDDPSFQAETAASYAKVANLLSDLGANPDALGASEKARRMYEKLVSEYPTRLEFQDALAATRQHALVIQGSAQLFWLTDPKVQEDLKLSEDQVQKIAALNKQVQEQREAFWGFARPRPEERSQKSDEHRQLLRRQARANADAIAAVLDVAQQKRLKQIGWQAGGTGVFFDPEVIVKLELTTDQIDRFHEIQDRAFKTTRDFWHASREVHKDQDWNAHRTKMEEIWRPAQEQMMSGLTAEQKVRWQEMVGELFKGEMKFFPPPPPHHWGHRPADPAVREGKGKPPPQE